MPEDPLHCRERWIYARSDMEALLGLEKDEPLALDEQTILKAFRQPRMHGRILHHPFTGKPVAWSLYRLDERRVALLHLRVHPAWRRRGLGSQLIECLKYRIEREAARQKCLYCEVPEEALNLQLFLKAHGLRADKIIPHKDGDLYRMRLFRKTASLEALCVGK